MVEEESVEEVVEPPPKQALPLLLQLIPGDQQVVFELHYKYLYLLLLVQEWQQMEWVEAEVAALIPEVEAQFLPQICFFHGVYIGRNIECNSFMTF